MTTDQNLTSISLILGRSPDTTSRWIGKVRGLLKDLGHEPGPELGPWKQQVAPHVCDILIHAAEILPECGKSVDLALKRSVQWWVDGQKTPEERLEKGNEAWVQELLLTWHQQYHTLLQKAVDEILRLQREKEDLQQRAWDQKREDEELIEFIKANLSAEQQRLADAQRKVQQLQERCQVLDDAEAARHKTAEIKHHDELQQLTEELRSVSLLLTRRPLLWVLWGKEKRASWLSAMLESSKS